MTSRRAGPVVRCLAAAALFGASTPAAKRLLGESAIGPFTLAGLLYVGAAAAVAPWALRGFANLRRMGAANAKRLAASVVFGGIVAPVLLLLGLRSAPSASVAVWLALEGFLTAVLAGLFFREHLGAKTWLAVAAALVASVVLAAPGGVGTATAAALVAGACLCWAIDNNVTSLLDGPTPAQTTFVKGLVAGGANLALGLGVVGESAPTSMAATGSALAVGAACYGASLVLYVAAAQRLGAARSQVVFATSPVFGLVLAWTALGEPVLAEQVAAAVVFGGAIALMLSDRHAHEHVHEPTTHTHEHVHDDGHHDHVHAGLAPGTRHTHEHSHGPLVHSHPHVPDLHHRHAH